MKIYCVMDSVACYTFRPPIVAIFRTIFFEGYITLNVKQVTNVKR